MLARNRSGHRRRGGWQINLWPVAKIFFREGKSILGCDVSRERKECSIGRVMPVVEFHELFAFQFLHCLRRSFARPAVGRSAVNKMSECKRSKIFGVRVLHSQRGKKLLALAVELFRLERGMENHIGHQIEAQIQILLHYAERDRGRIFSRLRAQRAADEINCLRDVLCRPALRSLREQVRRHLRDAGSSGRVLDGSRGEKNQARDHGGLAAIADNEYAQAVRKSLRGRRRETIWLRRARSGHLRLELYARRNDACAVLLIVLRRRGLPG